MFGTLSTVQWLLLHKIGHINHNSIIILMKLTTISALSLGCLLASATLTSCSDKSKTSEETSDEQEYASVTSVPLAFELKSAKKYYEITDEEWGENYLLTLEATVQWPDEISDYDLTPLQDTIMNIVGGDGMKSIDEAMERYVNDTADSGIGSEKAKFKEVDSIPQATSPNSFFKQIEVNFSEISSELITFNILYDQYIGGAHGMSGSAALTYNLSTGEFITTKWLFTDPGSKELLDAIKATIAENTGMTVAELERSALASPIPVSENVSIKNGMIVFHYNPYSVLPYSYGSIDAELSPYLLQNILTPKAKSLLISE